VRKVETERGGKEREGGRERKVNRKRSRELREKGERDSTPFLYL
jgi:hypothetical protein